MLRDFIRSYQDIFFHKTLERNLFNCRSVLDLGCGADSPLGKVKKTFRSIGVDLYEKSIDESKRKRIHDQYVLGDILKIDRMYKPKSFDAVIALDVIEHFDKKDTLGLLKKMEKIAREKVIILTPNGFHHQHHVDNPYEEHKSGWTVKDLKLMGYSVYGLRGLKFIRGEWTTIKYKPWLFWGAVAFFSEPLLYFFPNLSYHLFAVKDLNEQEN